MSLEEGIRSNTANRLGIDNTPNSYQLKNMKFVSEEIFDKIRKFVKGPLTCSSFLRVPALNTAVGSSSSSFHCFGGAIDLKKIGGRKSYSEIFHFIKDNLMFSELIWEYGNDDEPYWVHIAYLKGDERKMIKKAIVVNGKTKIVKWEK